MDELRVRSDIEMQRDAYIVVDCQRKPGWYKQSALILRESGFGKVLFLMP